MLINKAQVWSAWIYLRWSTTTHVITPLQHSNAMHNHPLAASTNSFTFNKHVMTFLTANINLFTWDELQSVLLEKHFYLSKKIHDNSINAWLTESCRSGWMMGKLITWSTATYNQLPVECTKHWAPDFVIYQVYYIPVIVTCERYLRHIPQNDMTTWHLN